MPSFSCHFFPFPTTPAFPAALSQTQVPPGAALAALQMGRCCCEGRCVLMCTAQHLGNLGTLLQLSPNAGARGPALARWAAFPPSKPHFLWLKVDGMGMVSQEQHCSSTCVCLQLSPFGRRSWRSLAASVSEARP